MRIFAIFIIYFTILSDSDAYNFQNFVLRGELKQLQNAGEQKALNLQEQKLRSLINGKILGPTEYSANKTNEDEDDRYASIFDKILEVVGQDYLNIGNRETGPLILNHEMGGGVVNFSGFSWQRPFANFKLYANRELAPDLYQDRWIVHDTLTIGISATTLLSNMRDLDLIDITDEGLTAFAGLGLVRTYHYYHFADTFLKGLTADYSKLFLSFTNFSPDGALKLDPYQIIKQEDVFSFNAGGFVTFPLWYGFGVKGGVLISKSYSSTVTIQSLGPEDNPREEEFLRLSTENEKSTLASSHLSLQLDFFNILKLTLFAYDLEYSIEENEKLYLSFYEKDREKLIGIDRPHFTDLIKGRTESSSFFPRNIVQRDQRKKQDLGSKFFFLLLGDINKSATEQIKIVKEGIEKIYFKHYAESKKIIQNFWSKIWGVIVHKIFKFKSSITNAAESSKKIELEYEFSGTVDDVTVDSEEKFSVKLTQNFMAQKTKGFWKKLYRKNAVAHVARYTMFDMEIARYIADSKIKGPMTIVTNIILEKSALRYFHSLTSEQVLREFNQICSGDSSCFKTLQTSYTTYAHSFQASGEFDILKFKKFLGDFYKKIRSNADFFLLFGVKNVFINGSIDAVTGAGKPYQNFFKSGQFKGLGVIDEFMRTGAGPVLLPIETN